MELEAAIVKTVRKSWPDVEAVYIFGSVALGVARSDSDIDIAVLAPPKPSYELDQKLDLEYELSSLTGREVDLIELRKAPTVLQKEIISTGKRVWLKDELSTEFFELFVWSSYQKLCYERAEIMADGLATGRFYHS